MQVKGNYVHSREITEYLLKKSNWGTKFFQNLGVNNGENLNNVVTAIGTAGVAPIFIRYNPIAKYYEKEQDPEKAIKTRTYSAWRQPLSAALTLAVLTPVNNTWNGFIDNLAAYKRIDRIDMAGKPPYSVLIKKAKADYDVDKNISKMRMIDESAKLGRELTKEEKAKFWPYENKNEYIRKRIAQLQDQAFYSEVKRLRQDPNVILEKEYNQLSAEQKQANKYKVIKDVDLLGPDDYKSAEKDAIKKLLSEKGVTAEEIEKLHISDVGSLKPKKVRKFLAEKGIADIKDFKEVIAKETEEIGVKNVLERIKQEADVKYTTSKLFEKMQKEVDTEISKINKTGLTRESYQKAVSEAKQRIFEETKANIHKLLDKHADTAQEPLRKMLAVIDDIKDNEIIQRACDKLDAYPSMDSIKFHGNTKEQVLRSVKIKHWEKVLINRAENVLKNFKKMTGIVIALAVLPLSCGLLNWVYPRFMEKFLPDLANVKTVSKDAIVIAPKDQKEQKENVTPKQIPGFQAAPDIFSAFRMEVK